MQSSDQRFARQVERRALRYIQQHSLMPTGKTVLVAVSGGPDSLTLLHLLANLQPQLGIEVIAAYIDHGMRPADEVRGERDFVWNESRRRGVQFVSTPSTMVGQPSKGMSPEDASRRGRYAALARLAEEVGATIVATGHTRTDQAETVLMRILRGSGMRGLAAMAPSAPWPVPGDVRPNLVRPLLCLSRHETESYCTALGLGPRHDPENDNPRYLRNRIRSDVMPLLTSLNPHIESTLADLAGEAQSWRTDVESNTPMLDVQVERDGHRSVTFNVEELRRLDAPRRLLALRSALDAIIEADRIPNRSHLLALDQLAAGSRGRSVTLPGGARAWREGGALMLSTSDPEVPPALGVERVMPVPGITELPGWTLVVEVIDDLNACPRDDWEQCFDAESIAGITVGPRRPGDRIDLVGLNGRRRLQDVFVDLGVPRAWRDRWPVLRTHHGVLWVPGLTRPAKWVMVRHGRAVRVRVQSTHPTIAGWKRL